MTFRTARAAVVAACAAVVLSGCGTGSTVSGERVDCDREDLAEFDRDCGYWVAAGVFELWWWVDPVNGGVAPAGWVPSGGSSVAPTSARGSRPSVRRQPAPSVAATTAVPGRRPGRTVAPRTPAGGATPRVVPTPKAVPAPKPAPAPRPAAPRSGR